MKRVAGLLVSLAALYLYGYHSLEKRKKLWFYGDWISKDGELSISYSGFCTHLHHHKKTVGWLTQYEVEENRVDGTFQFHKETQQVRLLHGEDDTLQWHDPTQGVLCYKRK